MLLRGWIVAVTLVSATADFAWLLHRPQSNSVVVRWSSSLSTIRCAAVPVEGGVGFDSLNSTTYKGSSISYNVSGFASLPLWSTGLRGLDPGVRNACRLPDGSVFTFRALGVPQGSEPLPHNLFIVGDIGRTVHSTAVIGAMTSHLQLLGAAPPPLHAPDAPPTASASVILLGDLSYADGTPAGWDVWQRLMSPLLSSVPATVVPGNHDVVRGDDTRAYEARFSGDDAGSAANASRGDKDVATEGCLLQSQIRGGLSGGRSLAAMPLPHLARPGYWDALVAPPFHVIYLCVYELCTREEQAAPGGRTHSADESSEPSPLGPSQSAWLEQELACRVNRTLTPFLVVALHPPLYHASASHIGEALTSRVREWLEPLLLRWRVDAVVGGHEHTFEVTAPMAFGTPVPTCEGGITHVTVGTGGAFGGGLFDAWVQPRPLWADREGAAWYGYATLEAVAHPLHSAVPARLTYWQVKRTGEDGSAPMATVEYASNISSHANTCDSHDASMQHSSLAGT